MVPGRTSLSMSLLTAIGCSLAHRRRTRRPASALRHPLLLQARGAVEQLFCLVVRSSVWRGRCIRCNTHVFESAGRNRRFSVPVASIVSIYCADNCDINVVTGSEHEAVVVQVAFPFLKSFTRISWCLQVCLHAVCAAESLPAQTHWHTGAKEHPLFLFRQLGAELKVAQQRQHGAEQAQSAAAELTVQIPERFCSLTVHDGAGPDCKCLS